MRIQRLAENGGTSYKYPPQYDATKVKFGPIYESGLSAKEMEVRERDEDDEFILLGVDDADFAGFMGANGVEQNGHTFTCEEQTKVQAVALGSTWTAVVEKVTNQNAVNLVLAKIGRGETLTDADRAVLNPDDSTPGINKTKTFEEDLTEAMG